MTTNNGLFESNETDDDEDGGITPEAQADGHRYFMGGMGSYCPRCTEQQGIVVLDCQYDTDK